VITRYSKNRRLYDRASNRPTNLDELAVRISKGEDVQVFEDGTRDITAEVYLEILRHRVRTGLEPGNSQAIQQFVKATLGGGGLGGFACR